MPIEQPINVVGQQSANFTPMPKDVYQFEVITIELKEGKKFQSNEDEVHISFTFACLEEEYYGRRIWKEVPLKFSGGQKPSGLYTVVAGLTGKEYDKDFCKDATKNITTEFLNALEKKQVRLSLGQKIGEQSGKLKNVIESYLPAKEQLPPFDQTKADAKTAEIKAKPVLDAEGKPLPDLPF